MKSSNWQEWSNWTGCRNGERTRFRSCVSSEITNDTISSNINFTDNLIVNDSLSMLCEMKKVETERQFCFLPNMNKNKDQKLKDPNPFTIEEEITATYLKRPKINPEPIKVIEAHRN